MINRLPSFRKPQHSDFSVFTCIDFRFAGHLYSRVQPTEPFRVTFLTLLPTILSSTKKSGQLLPQTHFMYDKHSWTNIYMRALRIWIALVLPLDWIAAGLSHFMNTSQELQAKSYNAKKIIRSSPSRSHPGNTQKVDAKSTIELPSIRIEIMPCSRKVTQLGLNWSHMVNIDKWHHIIPKGLYIKQESVGKSLISYWKWFTAKYGFEAEKRWWTVKT